MKPCKFTVVTTAIIDSITTAMITPKATFFLSEDKLVKIKSTRRFTRKAITPPIGAMHKTHKANEEIQADIKPAEKPILFQVIKKVKEPPIATNKIDKVNYNHHS